MGETERDQKKKEVRERKKDNLGNEVPFGRRHNTHQDTSPGTLFLEHRTGCRLLLDSGWSSVR